VTDGIKEKGMQGTSETTLDETLETTIADKGQGIGYLGSRRPLVLSLEEA
jgi:hypothetical protein